MAKLEVLEHKKLKLSNVIIKELKYVDLEDIDQEITKFINQLEVRGIQTQGPLITHNIGTVITEVGELKVDYEIMVQLPKALAGVFDYTFKKEVVIANCLYIKYQGAIENMQYAQAKLDLHMYEHDLIDTGQQYIIHIETAHETIEMDIFKPLEV
ncbi:MAG: AraC family transcriptional regulator [Culicoidibacterales bacterium]